MNEVLKAIADRRSIRKYEDRQITDEELNTLVDAVLQAPTARNSQPFHLTVVQDKSIYKKINDMIEPDRDIFYNAPTTFFLSSTADAPEDGFFAPVDCGIAIENVAIAAQSMGLGTVILGMPYYAFHTLHEEELESLLQFPKGYHFRIAIAIGYPAMTKAAHRIADNLVTFIK